LNKADNEYRIIAIGDSFTEGVGTTFDSTWVKQLELLLNKQKKHLFSCINAGLAGSDPFFEYMLLKGKLLIYKPDLVIINMIDNDIIDVIHRGGMERFKKNGKVEFSKPHNWEWIYASSFIFRLFINNVLSYDASLICKYKERELYKAAIDKIYNLLMIYSELALKNNFRILVTVFPMYTSLCANEEPLESLIRNYKMPPGIDIVCMYDYMTKTEGINCSNKFQYYWRWDCHPNGKGYAAFARGALLKLKQMGIIDTSPVR